MIRCAGCGEPFRGAPQPGGWACPACSRFHTRTELAAQAMTSRPDVAPVVHAPIAPHVLAESRPCLACGYDLRGLVSTGACPECGANIERSLRGNLLEFAATEFLRDMRLGARIVFIGTLVGMGLSFAVGLAAAVFGIAAQSGANVTGGRWTEVVPRITEFLGSIVVLAGWWLLSRPDPGQLGEDAGVKSRNWLRIFLVAEIAATLGAFVVAMVPGWQAAMANAMSGTGPPVISMGLVIVAVSGLATIAASTGRFFAAVAYIRTLAPRVPDATLHKEATRNLWLLPILNTVGILLCGLGPLAATILFLIMLHRLSKGVAAAMERAKLAALREQAVAEVNAMGNP
ncbi:MAG: hypothetical protein DYG92_05740 [Leptolyngbya sp. PLA1]|nr:hypothetical protein [Leptolyngbya sp. PLA1]